MSIVSVYQFKPNRKLGATHMLHDLFYSSDKMQQWKTTVYAIQNTHGMEKTKESLY